MRLIGIHADFASRVSFRGQRRQADALIAKTRISGGA
jgi:hypothetical protein